MKFVLLSIFILMITVVLGHAESSKPAEVSEQILFERPIGENGQRLLVTRGVDRDPAFIVFLAGDRGRDSKGRTAIQQMKNLYDVRVELSPSHGNPLLLASHLRIEGGMPQNEGLAILDCLIEPGRIFLLVAEGPGLSIWRIGINQNSTRYSEFVADKRWPSSAVPVRLDEKTIGAKLTRNDGRLTLELIEKQNARHASYEELEQDSLRFKLIKEWADGTP